VSRRRVASHRSTTWKSGTRSYAFGRRFGFWRPESAQKLNQTGAIYHTVLFGYLPQIFARLIYKLVFGSKIWWDEAALLMICCCLDLGYSDFEKENNCAQYLRNRSLVWTMEPFHLASEPNTN
jgi:hypothetical protein